MISPESQPGATGTSAHQGAVLGGRYRLDGLLGRGAMGEVWRAQHLMLGTPLAVKIVDLAAAGRPEILARFEQEARAAAFIDSPHAVRILDYGTEGPLAYIAMELLRGENLASRLLRLGKLEPGRASQMVLEMSRALTKAHAMGIVHRDIKPQNIMLAEVDGWEVAKLLDFGIAKVMTESMWAGEITGTGRVLQTHAGLLVGTPAYMSPEQTLSSSPLDGRSDLWQVAIVAFEAICGRRPFIGENLGQLFVQICNAPIVRPSEVADVPQGFDAWFERATQRDPALRFQTAEAMAEALAAVIPPLATAAARAPSLSLDSMPGTHPLADYTTTRGVSGDALSSSQWRFQLGLVGGLVMSVVVAGSIIAWWLVSPSSPTRPAPSETAPPQAATGSFESDATPRPTAPGPAPEQRMGTAPPAPDPSASASTSAVPAGASAAPSAPPPQRLRPEDILGL